MATRLVQNYINQLLAEAHGPEGRELSKKVNDHFEEIRGYIVGGIRNYFNQVNNPIILAHSQGTWLAYEALKRINEFNKFTFISCGSPLRKTRQKLIKPEAVSKWYNFWSWGDLITSNPLIGRSGAIDAADLNYHSWHRHSMDRYLRKHREDLKMIVT